MRNVLATIVGVTVFGFTLSVNVLAQEAGEYRSMSTGDWSASSTWEMFDGSSWIAATVAPTGSETITIAGEDTVSVDDAVSVSGLVRVTDTGVLTVSDGSLEVADGGTYEHARDAGDLPDADWAEGSTFLLTGTLQDAPGNRNQSFHHVIVNTPDLGRNRDMGLNDVTIGGDLTAISTGENRWQLTSADASESATVTILGDVIVEDGQLAVQGTGNALTEFVVHHHGDIIVTGGNFSAARGSQGSGSGTTTWFLYDGNFSMSNATTQNSNPTPGNAKFVFAKAGEQELILGENNDIADLSIEVADSTTLDVGTSEIEGNGIFVLQDGATVATAHVDGLAGNLLMSGEITIGPGSGVTYSGTAAQVLDTFLPDTLQSLTVANSEGVTVPDTNFAAVLRVDEGATLSIDSTGSLTVVEGSVDGTIVNSGELIVEEDLEFGATAVYEHARNGGSVPSGIWSEGSTALITGVIDEAPDNRGQEYHHLVFNTPDQLSNLHMSLNDATIGGDITVINTGLARWYLTSASTEDTATVSIMGDVFVEDGQFSVQGTGNALTTFVVHHYGDIDVTGGNFSISRGSQGGTGTTTWYLHEGDFSMSGARTQNSNSNNAMFVFDKDGVQQLILGEENQIDNLPVEVSSGTTLDMGSSELTGADLFTLSSGGTMATAHPDGVAGAIQTTGEVSLDEGASFTFNGSTAQITSMLMPVTVDNLAIDNEAGVQLSQETTINGVLRLMAGEFDNTIPFALGPDGSISDEGGSLVVSVSSERSAEIPTEFKLHQNYPNPFNPSTVIAYDIKQRSDVTVAVYDVTGREVTELVRGSHAAGTYQIEWNATGAASGVYYYQIRAGDFSATRSLLLVK